MKKMTMNSNLSSPIRNELFKTGSVIKELFKSKSVMNTQRSSPSYKKNSNNFYLDEYSNRAKKIFESYYSSQ